MLWTLTPTIEYDFTFRIRHKNVIHCFLSQLHKYTYYLKITVKAEFFAEIDLVIFGKQVSLQRGKLSSIAIIFRFSISFFALRWYFW